MPALSQYRAATGRSAVTYPEDLVRAQVPRLAEIRARQYQSDQLDLADRGLAQQADAQAQQQAAISQATGVQSVGTLVSTAGLVESVWPGTISGAAGRIGSSLGLTSAASGTAEAAGVATGAAGAADAIGASSGIIGIESGVGGVAGAAEAGVGVGGGAAAAEGAGLSAAAGAGSLGSAAIPGIGGGLAGGLLGAQLIGPLVPFGGKREKAAAGGAIGGALGGALAGAAATSWSGPGAIIGGAIGAVVGGVVGIFGGGGKKGGSVIATATFGIDSPETQTAQRFRRSRIGQTTYVGYRLWADPIAQAIESGDIMDVDVRRVLVDPCICAMAADLLGLPPYLYIWERAYLKLLVDYSREVGRAVIRRKRAA